MPVQVNDAIVNVRDPKRPGPSDCIEKIAKSYGRAA